MDQRIRFCASRDDVRIAYAVHGKGPPLVRAATWLTHLEFDWDSPVWRHWLSELGTTNTVVRYDERGCGLSDRDVGDLSLDSWVDDLEAVTEAAGLERFALLGISQGGPVAIAFAARHPDQVSHLILYGTYTRGRNRRDPTPEQREEAETLASLAKIGWGRSNPAFRRVFTNLFIPEATEEQMRWFDDLQRTSTSGETAVRLRRARNELEVTRLAPKVRVPTLVLHATEDALVPFEEGRLVATLIPDARFVPLEGRNHILLAGEPAWKRFLDEVRLFLEVEAPLLPARDVSGELTARERTVLRLVAEGRSNEEIAARLSLSVRTVERHLSNVYVKLGLSGKGARAAAAAHLTRAEHRDG